jgi:hypothetical protein
MYEYQYYDGTNDVEGQIFDVEVPTIGVWNGAAFHTDLVLFCDKQVNYLWIYRREPTPCYVISSDPSTSLRVN